MFGQHSISNRGFHLLYPVVAVIERDVCNNQGSGILTKKLQGEERSLFLCFFRRTPSSLRGAEAI